MIRKGFLTQILNKWNGKDARVGIIDWCNADGVFDLLEDIEPSLLDLEDFPELKEGDMVQAELVNHRIKYLKVIDTPQDTCPQ